MMIMCFGVKTVQTSQAAFDTVFCFCLCSCSDYVDRHGWLQLQSFIFLLLACFFIEQSYKKEAIWCKNTDMHLSCSFKSLKLNHILLPESLRHLTHQLFPSPSFSTFHPFLSKQLFNTRLRNRCYKSLNPEISELLAINNLTVISRLFTHYGCLIQSKPAPCRVQSSHSNIKILRLNFRHFCKSLHPSVCPPPPPLRPLPPSNGGTNALSSFLNYFSHQTSGPPRYVSDICVDSAFSRTHAAGCMQTASNGDGQTKEILGRRKGD